MRVDEYDRFSIVAFASDPFRGRMEALRASLPPSGRPILAPHVTLLGPFAELIAPVDLVARLRTTCVAATPLTARVAGMYDYAYDGFASVGVNLSAPTGLVSLHSALAAALADLCVPLGAAREGGYHPHVTIVQQIGVGEVPSVRARAEAFGLPSSVRLEEAALVARRRGGVWETLDTARFAGSAGG